MSILVVILTVLSMVIALAVVRVVGDSAASPRLTYVPRAMQLDFCHSFASMRLYHFTALVQLDCSCSFASGR